MHRWTGCTQWLSLIWDTLPAFYHQLTTQMGDNSSTQSSIERGKRKDQNIAKPVQNLCLGVSINIWLRSYYLIHHRSWRLCAKNSWAEGVGRGPRWGSSGYLSPISALRALTVFDSLIRISKDLQGVQIVFPHRGLEYVEGRASEQSELE